MTVGVEDLKRSASYEVKTSSKRRRLMMKWTILVAVIGLLPFDGARADSVTIINGGFEEPVVQFANGLQTYDAILGWAASDVRGFEVHRSLNDWQPYEGEQYIEVTHSVDAFQTFETVPGQVYILSYAYSPRPGVEFNPLNVYWDSALIGSHNESGLANSNTEWSTFSHHLLATSEITKLQFSTPRLDVGTFVDGVKVQPVPTPSAFALGSLGFIGVMFSRRMRTHRTA